MRVKTFARLHDVGMARAMVRVFLASTLAASAALSHAQAGYTGYDAQVSSLGLGTAKLTNAGTKPLPIGTELRIQIYTNFDGRTKAGTYNGYVEAAITSIDQNLKCPGVNVGQPVPGPSVPGEGLLFDVRCSLVNELAPASTVEMRASQAFRTGSCLNPVSTNRDYVYVLGRATAALPNGYVDEEPSNDATRIEFSERLPLPPC